ncbi:hypothetical protein WJX73_009829 [Symbiochloris irregularis]|uniref:Uncharacterized protein n=1 Tax=Symbiochloris irregularis TaxID=706552 RepID=A0AAW1NUC8_9CHLO
MLARNLHASSRQEVMDGEANPEAPESANLKTAEDRCGRNGKWAFSKLLDAPELHEHRAWKRSKLSLLTIGVAVVLVANASYIGFLSPPEGPAVPLSYFDDAESTFENSGTEADIRAPQTLLALIANKTYDPATGGYDFGQLSITDYAAIYTTVKPGDFCENALGTAFRVVNGFAFVLSVASVYVVAVLPLFTKRHHWDLRLARIGSMFMTVCLLCFLIAFILAGFITQGKGINLAECAGNFDPIEFAKQRRKASAVVVSGSFATVGFAGLLVLIIIGLSSFV